MIGLELGGLKVKKKGGGKEKSSREKRDWAHCQGEGH